MWSVKSLARREVLRGDRRAASPGFGLPESRLMPGVELGDAPWIGISVRSVGLSTLQSPILLAGGSVAHNVAVKVRFS
jgi:hypothetical protein